MFLVEMARRILGRSRVCPKCGHRQSARQEDRRTDRCEKCGSPLPPRGRGEGGADFKP